MPLFTVTISETVFTQVDVDAHDAKDAEASALQLVAMGKVAQGDSTLTATALEKRRCPWCGEDYLPKTSDENHLCRNHANLHS